MTNPYPQQQYPPSTSQQSQVTAPAAPVPVKGAYLIYILAATLAAITILLTLTSGAWDDAVAAGGASTNTSTLVNTTKIVTVVVGVILLALYLLFAYRMRAGRNWARIVLTVLSALSIVSSLSAPSSVTVNGNVYTSSSSQTTGWLGASLAIVAIVLMFLPASNTYFAASKATRQPTR